MSDMISRQEAIAVADVKKVTVEVVKGLKRLPSAQPTQPNTPNTLEALDCIRRQAAIDEIDEWIKAFLENGHKESAADACLIQDGIMQLPSAQPEPQWIPCSERLPEEYGEFLVTMTEKAKAKDLGFDIDETYIRKMRYNSNGWQLPRHIPSWINEAVKDEVLAWMPLPEPYKERRTDE